MKNYLTSIGYIGFSLSMLTLIGVGIGIAHFTVGEGDHLGYTLVCVALVFSSLYAGMVKIPEWCGAFDSKKQKASR